MAYVLDAAVILIFLLMIFLGYKRGVVRSLLNLGGSILALLVAWGLAAAVAAPIFDATIAPGVRELAQENITATDAASITATVDDLFEELPAPIVNGLSACGVGSGEEIAARLDDVVGTTTEAVADALVDNVIRPVGELLIRMVCFLILFIVLIIAARIAARLIDKVFKLPLLRQANGALGAVVGAVEGVIVVLVAVTVVQAIAASASADALISQQTVEDTHIVHAITEINPIAGTLDAVLAEEK